MKGIERILRTIKREQRVSLLERYPHFTKELTTKESAEFITLGQIPKWMLTDSRCVEVFNLWLNDELW